MSYLCLPERWTPANLRCRRADAINQAATIEAVRTAAATGTMVTLPTPTTG